jgi:hypothetical protein
MRLLVIVYNNNCPEQPIELFEDLAQAKVLERLRDYLTARMPLNRLFEGRGQEAVLYLIDDATTKLWIRYLPAIYYDKCPLCFEAAPTVATSAASCSIYEYIEGTWCCTHVPDLTLRWVDDGSLVTYPSEEQVEEMGVIDDAEEIEEIEDEVVEIYNEIPQVEPEESDKDDPEWAAVLVEDPDWLRIVYVTVIAVLCGEDTNQYSNADLKKVYELCCAFCNENAEAIKIIFQHVSTRRYVNSAVMIGRMIATNGNEFMMTEWFGDAVTYPQVLWQAYYTLKDARQAFYIKVNREDFSKTISIL